MAAPAKLSLPWKFRIFHEIYKFVVSICFGRDHTINRRLFNLYDQKAPSSNTPRNGVTSSDTTIDISRNLWFRLYTPTITTTTNDVSKMPIVVYFHGGGFAIFSANSSTYDNFCHRVAKEAGAVVISIHYRLAPEHKFPCQFEDGFDALKFLDNNFDDLMSNSVALKQVANPEWCFLAGDSAGGNLAHHVAVRAGECDRFNKLKVIGLIGLQPFFGGEKRIDSEIRNMRDPKLVLWLEITDWFWKAFLPNGSDRDHPATNVFGPKSTTDISSVKFPTTMVYIGGRDLLLDWQRRYCDGLKKGGKLVYLVEYPNAFHGSFLFEGFPEYSLIIEDIKIFIQNQLDK